MILDVARHKFYEGVITLLVIATIVAIRSSMLNTGVVPTSEEYTLSPVALFVDSFEAKHPIIAALAIFALVMHASLRLARSTVRFNIYGAASMAAISLTALLIAGMGIGEHTLRIMLIASLTAESIGRLFYCLGPNMRLHYLFTAMLSLGITPLLDGSMLAMVILALLLILTLRSNPREMVTTIAALTLPMFAYCYIRWCMGLGFGTSAMELWHGMLQPSTIDITEYFDIKRLILLGVLLFLTLCSAFLYRSERLSMSRTTRNIWGVMQATMLILIPTFAFLPSTSAASMVVLSIIAATMIPIFFVKMGTIVSLSCYIALIVLTLIVM